MEQNESALNLRLKLGYGIAYIGDTGIYNMLMMYTLFFLTDVAVLRPNTAGTVVFIATVWNMAVVAAIGFLSDRYAFKKGYRLPYMYASVLPMGVLLVLMFTVIGSNDPVKVVYYTVIHAALWTAHSTYLLPYEALGADLSANSAERTSIRSYARLFMGLGNLLGVVFILPLVGWFEARGFSQAASWQAVALLVAVISAAALYSSCRIVEKEAGWGSKREQIPDKGILQAYREVLKLKPLRRLMLVSFSFAVASVFFSSDIVYFMKYNLSLGDGQKTFLFLVLAVSGIVFTPFISGLAHRFSKECVMGTAFCGAAVCMVFFGLAGMHSLKALCVYAIIFNLASSAYWQLYCASAYDVCALAELQYGGGREAVVMSFLKIVLKFSTAVAVQAFGFILDGCGYRGEQLSQGPAALEGISACLTYVPAALLIAAAGAVYAYVRAMRSESDM